MTSAYDRWFCAPSDLVGIDPMKARGLVVECFFQAQHEAMIRSNESRGLAADLDTVRLEAEGAVRNAFKRTGGDFRQPDKASLELVVGSLAASAGKMGTPADIIEHHRKQIAMVLAGLPA